MATRFSTSSLAAASLERGPPAAPRTQREKSLTSLILWPLLLPLLLLFGVAATVFLGVNRNAQTAQQVTESQQRLQVLMALSKDIASLENGQRGYVITGNETFRQPYLDAQKDFTLHLGQLRKLRGPHLQPHNLNLLEQQVALWDQRSAQPEMQARQRSMNEAIARVKTGQGKRQLDSARTLLGLMLRNETERATSAIAANNKTLKYVRALTLGGLGLSISLVLLGTLRAARTVASSVSAFTKSAEQLAEGRYDVRLPATGVTELDTLGQQYHRMTGAVQQRQQLLEDSARELQLTVENLARSNRELERFAYVASHDLQEPLRTIGSYTELLAKRYKGQLDSRADQYIDFTISATQRLKNLIQDLLTFSRVHRPGRQFTQLDTAQLAETVKQNLADKIAQKGASVQLGELPRLRGNAELLQHIFFHLISNALKFCPSDRVPVVQVSARRLSNAWQFTVQDNGIGIAPEYQPKVFAVFQRLHGSGEYEGSGIGLAVSRSAAEQHGGTIWLESLPGEGSAFHFTVPDHIPESRIPTETPRT